MKRSHQKSDDTRDEDETNAPSKSKTTNRIRSRRKRERSRSSIVHRSNERLSTTDNEQSALTNSTSFTDDNSTNNILSNFIENTTGISEGSQSINHDQNTTMNQNHVPTNSTDEQIQQNFTLINSTSSDMHNNIETRLTTFDTNYPTMNFVSPTFIQTSTDRYFASQTTFLPIADLNQSVMEFKIRCKVIHKSIIKYFGTNSKVFDAIVCDNTGEIKIVAFNEEVDLYYNNININETISIENGDIRLANEQYRAQYSPYEICLLSITQIEAYRCAEFLPMMQINRQHLQQVALITHGSPIDVEGIVISDQGIVTTNSQNTGQQIRRRVLKLRDPTASVFVTIWNKKIEQLPTVILNKKLRIRNGRTHQYNDIVSINVSDQTIIEYY